MSGSFNFSIPSVTVPPRAAAGQVEGLGWEEYELPSEYLQEFVDFKISTFIETTDV